MRKMLLKTIAALFVMQCLFLTQAVQKGFAAQDPIDQEEKQLEQDLKQSKAAEDQALNRFSGLAGEMNAGASEEAQRNEAENEREQDDMLDAEEHDQDDVDRMDDVLRR